MTPWINIARSFGLALLVLASFPFGGATAQPSAGQHEGVEPATDREFTVSHLGAARAALQAIFIDSGFVAEVSLEAFRASTPTLRSQVTSLPFYASLSVTTQQALIAYVDGFPTTARAEAILAGPELIDRFTPRIAAIFTEQELLDISAFMGMPALQQYGIRAGLRGVRGESMDETPASEAEHAAANQFAQTPGGIAFVERRELFARMMRDLGFAMTSHPRISARLRRDLCVIVAELCPMEWRAS